MGISLQEFREQFCDRLLQIHWRQWSALGVSSQVPPEEKWIIDLEALSVSTLVVGIKEKRLFQVALEWLLTNRKWINLQRVKRILGHFTHVRRQNALDGLLNPEIADVMMKILKKDKPDITIKAWVSQSNLSDPEYRNLFEQFQKRGVVTEPILRPPSLLQLRLRALLGIEARGEVLLYLLFRRNGNSNSIAKETFLNQRNVYEILDRWHQSGILTKIKGPRAVTFSLERREDWWHILEIGEKAITYVNWIPLFRFLDSLFKVLHTPPWEEDEYLLSSFFRDILVDAQRAGRCVNMAFPEPALYSGTKYFAPFAQTVLKFVEGILEGPENSGKFPR